MNLDIKTVIKSHGLEVREVASRMGISPTALSQHLNGKVYKGRRVPPNPSMDILQRIADAVGCEVVEFFVHNSTTAFTMLVEYNGKTYSAHTIESARTILDKLESINNNGQLE